MVEHFIRQPLSSGFMLASIVGFLVSALIVWEYSVTWGFTFALVFMLWFVASVYNFTHAEDEGVLDIHDSEALKRKSRAN